MITQTQNLLVSSLALLSVQAQLALVNIAAAYRQGMSSSDFPRWQHKTSRRPRRFFTSSPTLPFPHKWWLSPDASTTTHTDTTHPDTFDSATKEEAKSPVVTKTIRDDDTTLGDTTYARACSAERGPHHFLHVPKFCSAQKNALDTPTAYLGRCAGCKPRCKVQGARCKVQGARCKAQVC